MLLFAASCWMQVHAGAQSLPPASHSSTPPTAAVGDSTPPPLSASDAEQRFHLRLRAIPDTVTVGQHFTFTVSLRVPASLAPKVQFPASVDSVGQELTSSFGAARRTQAVTADGMVDMSATYEVAAWDIGAVPLGLGDLIVGADHVDLNAPIVNVRSVLPKDSVKREKAEPKKARGLFPVVMIIRRIVRRVVTHVEHDYRLLIAAIVGALLLIGEAIAWWIRARRRRLANAPVDWVAWAEREFRRIEAMHLLEEGKPEQYAILMTNVLRKTLVQQFPTLRASATTHEMVTALQREPTIPAQRTLALFERVDVLKFAGLEAEVADARTVGLEDWDILQEIKIRREAERAAQDEAAAQARAGGGVRPALRLHKSEGRKTRRGA